MPCSTTPPRRSPWSHTTDATPRTHPQQQRTMKAEVVRAFGEPVADHPTLELHRATAEGPARMALMNASAAADLLIVGAQRRHGHFGLQLGRVAHAVLHHSVCPVALIPQLV
ncbi:universal stress protein [Streptomyces lunaelactis]|uniref:universal stress protein n=1 Tax=Streptomyces lunaelactis TaxID=1535768 RepID=UPI0015858241|nr:universal stress protein [Streptomyces lunaelactis]NUL01904.1 universal stress protein [Streptomyces lunaelactis]